MHTESREGDYNGGTDLASCGYMMDKFGEDAAVAEEKLAGPWTAESTSRFTLGSLSRLTNEQCTLQRCGCVSSG